MKLGVPLLQLSTYLLSQMEPMEGYQFNGHGIPRQIRPALLPTALFKRNVYPSFTPKNPSPLPFLQKLQGWPIILAKASSKAERSQDLSPLRAKIHPPHHPLLHLSA